MVRRDGRWVRTSWDEALATAAAGLAKHRGRFGALASAKATNEDGYAIQKFCRVVMQTNDVDHCTRLCHSPSVEAMLACMGSGATSNSYQDYAEAGCLIVVGADASANHPVIAIRFRGAVSRGARLIVVNPKRVDLCDQADLWLQPRPGTDVALFNAMARVVLDEGLANLDFVRTRTDGFEAWRASLASFTLAYAERVTGVPASDIAAAARWYARPPFAGSCLIWGMGITQHTNGIHNAHAVLNLALVAGQMGFPASGISPLRGQNNVQGCGGVRREGGHVHQLGAARPARAPGPPGAGRGAPGLVDHVRARQARGEEARARGRRPVRLRGAGRDLRRDGAAHAAPRGPLARPSRPRGRHPVAVPHAGPPGHAIPLRGVLPDGARAVHSGAPNRGGRRAPRPRLPLRPEHRAPPLPLARRDAHAPGRGAARAGAAPRGRDPPGRYGAARRGHRAADPRGLAARPGD